MLDVIYEDNHLLVINKPAGLLTQPSGTQQESLEAQAKSWLKQKYHKLGNIFLHAIHRLDKPVSGVVVFARTSKALSRLNATIRDKKSKKIYYALVEGALPSSEGILEHSLSHEDFHSEIASEGKLARLHYRVIKKTKTQSLLEITLETGRYHQIRIQLSAIGCPIVGDKKYGSVHPFPYEGIALHHHSLSIPHPISGEMLTIQADVPSWFY
jgi:23S rRNA pseudouridine1911/1915/1917 synthase